ncbi:hypothetical protein TNCT_287381 [Trichonephila clavata]|uniref:Uncharacterized protein n=1 Tax=Trichonephila clavata TaxID=2740835 RepID=A0A8X6FIZ2_TRICU|nr:hypothetical protein TNCT_287381 [Trichonephila clavata]
MPDERSQGPPCRMEACVARQVLKIFMDSFKPLFCCVDGCIFCSGRYPAVHGQVGGIVLLTLLNNVWDRGRDGAEKVAPDIKSGHCDPKKWACFSIRTFSNERPWAVSLFRKGIHCVLKCLRRSIDRFEALLCSLKRHGVCWTAGKRIPRWRGEGGGKNNTFLSVCSLKLYGCRREVSRTPCRMEACVARQSP